MVLLKILISLCVLFAATGCQLGYILESGYYQADLLKRRVPIDYAIENYKLSDQEVSRLKLAKDVRQFMKTDLGLDVDSNFTTYVQLDRPYVTYIVSAAHKDELKAYTWSYPIVGEVPYKGYFKKEKADDEAKSLQKKDLDTYVRGVSAYSTLGWFADPLLSSMLRYKEHDFVSTLIHETVHTNLYIKSESKFNERVANFMGQLGAELFYQKKGKADEFRKTMKKERADDLIFSEFISEQIKMMREWYKAQANRDEILKNRGKKFQEITEAFTQKVKPKLQTNSYDRIASTELNNALLLQLELYLGDFSDLEKLAEHYQKDFKKVLEALKTLEDETDPESKLKSLF
ncbi:MAG: aminopeptidase [Bdellovibrionales bacterium]|nr:aminopeptidase [Bdellovibrionales bacterium]